MKHLILLEIQNMRDIKEVLLQWFIIFLKKSLLVLWVVLLKVKSSQQLPEELHKPIIRKFKKRWLYSSFKENIWGADLADIQLISKYNNGIRFLLCVIDIFSKYICVVPLKDEWDITITSDFQKILEELNQGPNEIWVDKIWDRIVQ